MNDTLDGFGSSPSGLVERLGRVAHRVAGGAVARPAQAERRLVAAAVAGDVEGAGGGRHPRPNSLACSLVTETTPEWPALVTAVTRRLTPRSVSRPPRSSPLLAECVNTVARLGVAAAVAGTHASIPTTSAADRTTLTQELIAKPSAAYQRGGAFGGFLTGAPPSN